MERGRPWYSLSLFTLLLTVGTPTHSQVLWHDEARTRPRFIPESVLAGKETSSLSDAELAKVRTAIRERVALYSVNWPCAPQVIEDADPSSGIHWRSLREKLQTGRLVLRGEVIELQAGWSPWPPQAVTLVQLRLREILGGKTSLPLDSTVRYVQSFGEMELDGIKVCTLPMSVEYGAAVGDEIVVAATGVRGDENVLGVDPKSDIYPIRNHAAVVMSPNPPEEPGDIPLETLRRWRPREGNKK